VVRFEYERYNGLPVVFNLNTNSQFRSDTIIEGYKFSLTGLSPYPALGNQIKQNDYKAEIVVKKNQ
jgi:hypothetical protein